MRLRVPKGTGKFRATATSGHLGPVCRSPCSPGGLCLLSPLAHPLAEGASGRLGPGSAHLPALTPMVLCPAPHPAPHGFTTGEGRTGWAAGTRLCGAACVISDRDTRPQWPCRPCLRPCGQQASSQPRWDRQLWAGAKGTSIGAWMTG